MTIGLRDVDGKIPNLALMKISTYYKEMGVEVGFTEYCKEGFVIMQFNELRRKR